MASGVKICDEVKTTVGLISIKSLKQRKLQFCIMKFSEDLKQIVVDRCGTDMKYEELIKSLPDDDVRYVCYDFEYISKDGIRKSDLLWLSWHPENCTIRKKMICASSLNALKAALSITRHILEGDNRNEVNTEAALEKVGGKGVPT